MAAVFAILRYFHDKDVRISNKIRFTVFASTLVQIMTEQAEQETSDHLSQCWYNSPVHICVIRPQSISANKERPYLARKLSNILRTHFSIYQFHGVMSVDWDALLLLCTPANHQIQKKGKSIMNDAMKTRYSDMLYLKIYIAPMLRKIWGNS